MFNIHEPALGIRWRTGHYEVAADGDERATGSTGQHRRDAEVRIAGGSQDGPAPWVLALAVSP